MSKKKKILVFLSILDEKGEVITIKLASFDIALYYRRVSTEQLKPTQKKKEEKNNKKNCRKINENRLIFGAALGTAGEGEEEEEEEEERGLDATMPCQHNDSNCWRFVPVPRQ